MSTNASANDLKHPYYPWDLKLPNYVPNDKSNVQLLGTAGAVVVLTVLVGWIISGRRKVQFCFLRRVALCWFLVCGVIHTVLEGYFVIYNKTLAGHTSFLGQCWKEYAKGDSRYLTSDTFLVSMEGVTAVVDGSLAFLTFVLFLRGSNYRYALQLMLSLFQLYGDCLYFLTEILEDLAHGPGPYGKERMPFYFYFLTLNLIWIVVPLALIYDAVQHMASCQSDSDSLIDEHNRKVLNNKKKIK